MAAPTRRLGKCIVCGTVVVGHSEGYEHYYGKVRTVTCLGSCTEHYDALLAVFVRKVKEHFQRLRVDEIPEPELECAA